MAMANKNEQNYFPITEFDPKNFVVIGNLFEGVKKKH